MLNPVREALARLASQLNCAAPAWAGADDDRLPIDASLMPLDLAAPRRARPSASVAPVRAVAAAGGCGAGGAVPRAA